VIAVEGLAAGYGREVVLRDVSFAAEPGERVAVLGPNGGGKTTLLRVLLGELAPVAGQVRAPRCAVVPQTDRTRLDFPVSALDVATLGALGRLPWWRRPGRAERADARAALCAVGLGDLADRTFGELSGGQRQRVLVARAIVQDAPVILLDEPFSGVDVVSAEVLDGLIDDLARAGRTLLICTHEVAQALRWDRVLCLNRRQVAYGEPAATLTPSVLEETYGGALLRLPELGAAVLPPDHHGT
jgi:ABC-type Mn2+/Zn2+ transport system ATPase subunit